MVILVVVGDDVMSNEPATNEIDLEAKKCVIDKELPVEQCADVVAVTDGVMTISITDEGKNSDNTGKLFFFSCT